MYHAASQLYARQLLPKKHGYPLYYPGPLESSSTGFRKRGTGIGDVGIITSRGAFKFAFNLFTPRSNIEINHLGVPDGFHPLPIDQRDIERNIDKHAKGSEIFGCAEKEDISTSDGQNG